MYFLGLDIGTTGCKSMLFDEKLNIISEDYIEYDLQYPDSEFVEQNPLELWEMTKQTIKNTVTKSKVVPEQIKAMGISTQGIAFVPINKDGKELYNIISWLDTRAKDQIKQIEEVLDADYIFKTTGKRISASYTLPKIMWLKDNKPDVYENTYKFLMVMDYVTYKLTGEIKTDYSMASGTMMLDITKRDWDMHILNSCGIDTGKLPQVKKMGDMVGILDAKIASELGLNPDTKVVLGAQDQKCAALGAGIEEGIVTVSLGTSTAISVLCKEPVLDKQQRIPCFALDEKNYVLEAVISTSGVTFKWLKKLFGMEYDDMCTLAEKASLGSNELFFYPHFTGAASPYWKENAKGFFYGISLNTDKSDMIRSLLEGIAFQMKINIDAAQEITGIKINEIRLFGGGSNQELWAQIIADVTGLTVSILYTSEVANVGAAMLAMGAIEHEAKDLFDINMIKIHYEPDTYAREKYIKVLQDYLNIQNKIIS